jgi:hypothetical protein
MLLAAGAWMGCASNGDSAPEPPGLPASSLNTKHDSGSSSSSPSSGDNSHPAFEAGFQDSSTVDPTPDGGDACLDPDDPGSNEQTAKHLADTTDAQNDAIVVKGVLSTPVDIDFYAIKVADTYFHVLTADLQDATPSTEMCVFMKCLSGTTNFKGCTDGVQKTSDIGDQGCCTAGPGKANPDWSCGGITQFDDSAQLYFRIKETAGGSVCLPYSFSYAF